MSGLLGQGTHGYQPQAGKPFLAPPKGQGPLCPESARWGDDTLLKRRFKGGFGPVFFAG